MGPFYPRAQPVPYTDLPQFIDPRYLDKGFVGDLGPIIPPAVVPFRLPPPAIPFRRPQPIAPARKKRGRPRTNPLPTPPAGSAQEFFNSIFPPAPPAPRAPKKPKAPPRDPNAPKRPRGRPRKNPLPSSDLPASGPYPTPPSDLDSPPPGQVAF